MHVCSLIHAAGTNIIFLSVNSLHASYTGCCRFPVGVHSYSNQVSGDSHRFYRGWFANYY